MVHTSHVFLTLSLAACAGNAPEGEDVLPPACTDCRLTDAHNYSIQSEMTAEVVQLQALTDATIDWSALTMDVQGHPVDPRLVDRVLLVAFAEASPQEVVYGLERDLLTQSEVAIYVLCEPEGATSCRLSDFGILDSTFDVEQYFLPSVQSWMVVPTAEGQQGGFSFLFLQASEDSSQTDASIDNQTASLTVKVDLRSGLPLVVPQAEPALTLDWTSLETDGLGNPMEPRTATQLLVGRYDMDLATLEQNIFDLETGALELWQMDLSGGTSTSLEDLEGQRPFPGIDDQDTWLVALRCPTCTHPAPRFMAQLVPDPG